MAVDEYQYATMSAYSPTMSELPLTGEPYIELYSKHLSDIIKLSN
jgi:hypothetical protein